ncbi:MAG: toprim domain-containing protein [Archaeoglobaceae archaeon]
MIPEDFLEFLKVLEELRERSSQGWIIVVEGAKDVASLKELGVENVRVLRSYSEAAELIGENVIVLTDFDREGERKAKRLREVLINADFELRHRLFCRVKKEVTKVEELSDFVRKYERNILRTTFYHADR